MNLKDTGQVNKIWMWYEAGSVVTVKNKIQVL